MKFLIGDCPETRMAVSNSNENLGFIDRVRLKIHLWICPPCAGFKEEDELFNKSIEKALVNDNQVPDCDSLSPEEKEAMQKCLKEKLSGN